VLPAPYTFVLADTGFHTFSATLKTSGNQTITATDTVTSSITGTDSSISVVAAAATHFAVSAPSNATAGAAFNVTVTAKDQFGNTDTSYAGTLHFTSSDPQAVLPANSTLTNGLGTFSVTLKTAGNQTITATDTVTSSITGSSGGINVAPGAATHFVVTGAPANATAGVAFNFTLTAQDQFGATVSGYAGTVHFTSSDPQAVLPANSTLTNGVGTFSATLKTAGNQTFTATDTGNSGITVTTSSISVTPGPATHFMVSAPPSVTSGAPFNFTVTAQDQFGNTAGGYAGTVHFTSGDPQATLPADAALANGVGAFVTILRTVGIQTLTATDTGSATITGASGGTSVTAPAPPPVATATNVPTMTFTPSPTATSVPVTAANVPATETSTSTPIINPTSMPTSTPTPSLTPTQTPIVLVIHNSPRTVVGGRSRPCDLAGNTKGANERGCEIVSSVSAAGAMVTYTLTYQDGSTQRFVDRADSRGHSLHPFNVVYRPSAHKGHKPHRVAARISVQADLPAGTVLGPVYVRFAVIR
jgi:hypothetical protein